MSLFDPGVGNTLADVLNSQATTQTENINKDYAKKRRLAIAQGGASGRLRSGVQNYTMGDINANQINDLGGVQSNLADALAGVSSQDYLGTQDSNRNARLARMIAELNKPSDLESAFGAIGAAGRVGGTVAAFL